MWEDTLFSTTKIKNGIKNEENKPIKMNYIKNDFFNFFLDYWLKKGTLFSDMLKTL